LSPALSASWTAPTEDAATPSLRVLPRTPSARRFAVVLDRRGALDHAVTAALVFERGTMQKRS
jgi:hypothetical protein